MAAQRKASTTTETKRSWPQRILVAEIPRGDAHPKPTFNRNPLAVVVRRTVA